MIATILGDELLDFDCESFGRTENGRAHLSDEETDRLLLSRESTLPFLTSASGGQFDATDDFTHFFLADAILRNANSIPAESHIWFDVQEFSKDWPLAYLQQLPPVARLNIALASFSDCDLAPTFHSLHRSLLSAVRDCILAGEWRRLRTAIADFQECELVNYCEEEEIDKFRWEMARIGAIACTLSVGQEALRTGHLGDALFLSELACSLTDFADALLYFDLLLLPQRLADDVAAAISRHKEYRGSRWQEGGVFHVDAALLEELHLLEILEAPEALAWMEHRLHKLGETLRLSVTPNAFLNMIVQSNTVRYLTQELEYMENTTSRIADKLSKIERYAPHYEDIDHPAQYLGDTLWERLTPNLQERLVRVWRAARRALEGGDPAETVISSLASIVEATARQWATSYVGHMERDRPNKVVDLSSLASVVSQE